MIPAVRQTLEVFGGINANPMISEGEFSYMENLSARCYPLLSPRLGREQKVTPQGVTGMVAKDGLCYTEGSDFVINDYRVPMGLTDQPKQLISMGAYVLILPDKKYINTADLSDYGSMEAEFTTDGPTRIRLCDSQGQLQDVALNKPQSPENLALWADEEEGCLKQWSQDSETWVKVESTFLRIDHPGIGAAFSVYDGVVFSGLAEALPQLEGAAVLEGVEENYLVISGFLDKPAVVSTPLTVSRKMPAMDFVVESGNRLWGCRYGLSDDGRVVNELYACKLGDFKNWNCYRGLSTDSYTVSLGSDGPFTGAVTHLGYPIFFKEGCMHKVYGRYPANFSIQTTHCRGVQRGCEKSLALVGETLLYKSLGGVMAYDGSLPRCVSKALGAGVYGDAVAGSVESRYYISMVSEDGASHLFVYDTEKNLWHREDDLRPTAFCTCRGKLYCATADRILRLEAGGQERVEFLAVTGPLGIRRPERKYVRMLQLRLSMAEGSRLGLFVRYDSGPWEQVCQLQGDGHGVFVLPIRPKRCDRLQLRLEGRGDVKLYAITKTVEEGSELP